MTHPKTAGASGLENGGNNSAGGGSGDSPAGAAPKPARRGGLGRGLSALIPQASHVKATPRHAAHGSDEVGAGDSSTPDQSGPAPRGASESVPDPASEMLRMIALRSLSLNPQQPRKEFNREELDDLAASIKEHGILQPVAVRVKAGSGADASYELIAGERRFRAASAAGLTEIPALVKEDVSDRDSLALAIIENVQREDLNIIEAAQGYDELLHAYNMTQTELAQSIGKSQPQIANALRMLNLPAPIQDSLRASSISEGHAKVILSLKSEPEQTALWSEIVSQGLTVRNAEKRAATLRAAPSTPARPAPVRTSPGWRSAPGRDQPEDQPQHGHQSAPGPRKGSARGDRDQLFRPRSA